MWQKGQDDSVSVGGGEAWVGVEISKLASGTGGNELLYVLGAMLIDAVRCSRYGLLLIFTVRMVWYGRKDRRRNYTEAAQFNGESKQKQL